MNVKSVHPTKTNVKIDPKSKLDVINSCDANPLLNEMKCHLESYKVELDEAIRFNKKIANNKFKKNFFSCLENLLYQVVHIKEKRLREQKIETIHKWYKNKQDFFLSVNQIDSRTDKNYYEDYLNISSVRNDYYAAKNYPREFEKEHRTEEMGILPPKDRLKDYKTKKIVKEEKEKVEIDEFPGNKADLNSNGDKLRLLSATSSVGMRSTFHTANQTQSKFPFGQTNNSNCDASTYDTQREIKSSYSFFRPKYDYPHLVVEKTTMQAKNRELAGKRNQEEMKDFLNEFGLGRARYKEEVAKKYDTKRLVHHYEHKLKTNTEETKTEVPVEKNVQVKTVFVDNESQMTQIKLEQNETLKEEVPRVDINNIKNLDKENKILMNEEEVKISIKLKGSDHSRGDSTLREIKSKVEKMPSDATAKMKIVDKIYNTRQTYAKMLDVKEIDNAKSEYKHHYNPLSAFDSSNVEVLTLSPEKKVKSRPSTGYEFVRDNFQKENLLKSRKTLSGFKLSDFNRLKDKLMKYSSSTVSFHTLRDVFLPPGEEVRFPKFYLPSPGSDILARPIDPSQKMRAKSTKKKKK